MLPLPVGDTGHRPADCCCGKVGDTGQASCRADRWGSVSGWGWVQVQAQVLGPSAACPGEARILLVGGEVVGREGRASFPRSPTPAAQSNTEMLV